MFRFHLSVLINLHLSVLTKSCPLSVLKYFAHECADKFAPVRANQFVPESVDESWPRSVLTLRLSVLTNLHLSVLTNFAPESADDSPVSAVSLHLSVLIICTCVC